MDLRKKMPIVAAFVSELRATFGADVVNQWISGRNGGWFCAEENGIHWRTPGRSCDRCKRRRDEQSQ
jgi:hypothetical protein